MPIQIVDAGQVTVDSTVVTLYGPPNVGKTTLALTAERPVLLDFDDGIQRAVAVARQGKGVVRVKSWKDVANFAEEDFKAYATVVVDTVGTCLDKLMLDVNPSGSLKITEWGELGTRFKSFVNRLRSFGLDIVFVAHGSEEQRGDVTVDRIVAPGNMGKQLVYQTSDLIGRLYIGADEARVLTFNPTATSFGKNVGTGIPPMGIPDPAKTPDALARIIAQAKHLMNESSAGQQEAAQRLDVARSQFQGYSSVEQFNEALGKLLASGADRTERQMLLEVAQSKGMHYDKDAKTFVLPPAEPAAEAAAEVANDDPFA